MLASLFSAVLTSSVQGQWCLCFCSIFSRESGSLAFIKILPNSSTHFTHLHYILVQSLNWIWLLWPHGLQQARILSTPLFPGICSNLCPLSWWCYLTVLSFVVPFSSCLQCFPALGSFPTSLCFVSGGQRIGASASASVLPEDIPDWCYLLTDQGILKSLLQLHNSKALYTADMFSILFRLKYVSLKCLFVLIRVTKMPFLCSRGRGYMYNYAWFSLLYGTNQCNV